MSGVGCGEYVSGVVSRECVSGVGSEEGWQCEWGVCVRGVRSGEWE